MKLWIGTFTLLLLITSCNNKKKDKPTYKTEYVIVVVVDGARITETWHEPNRANIPRQNALYDKGVLVDNFRNNGPTWTMCGHGAISTGRFAWIDNSGAQLPDYPTIFQLFQKQKGVAPEDTWIIASKGKIEALSNCQDSVWFNKFRPFTNCGINGGGATSGYRDDSTTFVILKNVLKQTHPKLVLVNFRQPDYSGHQADSIGYINGIRSTDAYVSELWKLIQTDPIYQNKTTLFVTNDHGRHLDGIADGFVSHGDACEGCRHLSLFALGPDFKTNTTISTVYQQIDLPKTIGELLGFTVPEGNGMVMRELFK